MYSPVVVQQWVPLEYAEGTTLSITFPITYNGTSAVDATITTYIYEGSALPTHGSLLKKHTKDVHFDPGDSKDVTFQHTTQKTGESRRDVGLTISVGGQEVVSREWDDLFYVTAKPGWLEQMVAMMMMVMMMGVMIPMMEKEE